MYTIPVIEQTDNRRSSRSSTSHLNALGLQSDDHIDTEGRDGAIHGDQSIPQHNFTCLCISAAFWAEEVRWRLSPCLSERPLQGDEAAGEPLSEASSTPGDGLGRDGSSASIPSSEAALGEGGWLAGACPSSGCGLRVEI